jgi:D-sedoheptulose 7-phosphate isomerase
MREGEVTDRRAIGEYLDELRAVLAALDVNAIDAVIQVLLRAYRDGRTVFICGNGGSASTASHFACDLGKNVAAPGQRRFRVMSLADNLAVLTAWANDTAYSRVFAEQLEAFVAPGDVVIAVSGSGNSPNVLEAMKVARAHGATTVGLIGFRGGRLAPLCDLSIVVPWDQMDQIEDAHLALQHLICRTLRQHLTRERELASEARHDRELALVP